MFADGKMMTLQAMFQPQQSQKKMIVIKIT